MISITQIPLPIQLYVPLMVAALLVASFIGLLALSFHDRRAWTSFQRGRLGRRLRGLRMNRMLGVRDIGCELYVQLTPIAVLRKELDSCLNCLSKSRCDTSYIVGVESDPGLCYCPNTPSLDWAWGKRRF